MSVVAAALCGFVLDLLLADPRAFPHPVVWSVYCVRVFPKHPAGSLLRVRCWRRRCRWARWR